MSSGSYLPPPVKRVEIPKDDGRMRVLGIPTVSDRVAQMVVKLTLEPELDKIFHEDSYGYRPNKSALQAVGQARERCWRYNWVVDLDIKGFFDNIDHELMMTAVRRHTQDEWVLLYVERWLKAPVVHKDGTLEERGKGTPQGGVVSPVLANLFLHYVFDKWMGKNHPEVPFEVIVQIPPMHFLFIACKIILDKVFGYKSVYRLHLTSCLDSAFWLAYMRVLSIARHEQRPHRERFFKVPQNAM